MLFGLRHVVIVQQNYPISLHRLNSVGNKLKYEALSNNTKNRTIFLSSPWIIDQARGPYSLIQYVDKILAQKKDITPKSLFEPKSFRVLFIRWIGNSFINMGHVKFAYFDEITTGILREADLFLLLRILTFCSLELEK